MQIKAITLWQPWASLLALGPKKYETRSWKTNHRGWIAIHAASKFDGLVNDAYHRFEKELIEIGYDPIWEAPRGAVVAIANLSSIIKCGGALTSQYLIPDLHDVLPYGDYSPGRFVWVFSEIVPVLPPVPATGGQRLWNWDAPGTIQLLVGQLDEQ